MGHRAVTRFEFIRVDFVQAVLIVGGPAPYREALSARLAARGRSVTSEPPVDEVPATLHQVVSAGATVAVFHCSTETDWDRLAGSAEAGYLGRVAVIVQLEAALYRRALAMGVGVVHHDTSTDIMAQVIESAGHGEALIPMQVARRLMAEPNASGSVDATALDRLEIELLRGIFDGETIVSLGERFHFSERTVRRRLQSAYLKLGVDDRTSAIRMIERDRLLDEHAPSDSLS
jgi:DNA-binding CsgD family transcriptional regulator